MPTDPQLIHWCRQLDERMTKMEIYVQGQNGQNGLIRRVDNVETGLKDLKGKLAINPFKPWQPDEIWKLLKRMFKVFLAITVVVTVLKGETAWKEIIGLAKLVLG